MIRRQKAFWVWSVIGESPSVGNGWWVAAPAGEARVPEKPVRKVLIPGISDKASSLFGERYYHDLMFSPMPLYILLACSVYAFCLLKVFLAAMDAPIGYEDRKGFHYGMETVSLDTQP